MTATRVEHPAGHPGWRAWLAGLSPRAVDALIAAGLAAVVTLAAMTSHEPGARDPSTAAALALGGTTGALTLLRRRWPVGVLLATVAALLAYHAPNFPAIGIGWPLAVALYTCASTGHLRAAVLVTAAVEGGSLMVRTLLESESEPLLGLLSSSVRDLAAIGLVLAFGDAVRSRRGWTAEVQERLRRLERDREQEARRRVVDERLRIARELHDIMAHTLAVATVQLNVAADAIDEAPGEARKALRTAQQVAKEATAELRTAVRVLRAERDGDPPRAPAPGLDDLGRLVDAAREAGLRVELEESGQPEAPLPARVGLAVYRVVQESLTNVLKHAGATAVQVRVAQEPSGVSVRVADNGAGPRADPPGDPSGHPSGNGDGKGGQVGNGLIGMRERVLGLGGEFSAGPAPGGGFAVHAWIPTEAGR